MKFKFREENNIGKREATINLAESALIFFLQFLKDHRKLEAEKIRSKYPDRIPVISQF